MSWKEAWWNVEFDKRANLLKLPKELRLANDPWFTLKRENVYQVLDFVNKQQDITKTICNGGLANESLFAIILYCYKQLELNGPVIQSATHIVDWNRMESATSPHLFKIADEKDIKFIDSSLEKNKYAMFIRKVSTEFPDQILRHYIYEQNKNNDNKLILREPNIFTYNRIKKYLHICCPYFMILMFVYFIYFYLI
jgi:hypothetical protein